MVKEPLFAVIIALFKALFGDRIDLLVLLQILVSPLIAIFVYLIGRRLFDEKVARFSALLVAVIPIYADMSISVLPEGFFIVLFVVTMLLVLRLDHTASTQAFLLAGVSLGVCSLVKNVLVPMAVLYPAGLLV